MRWLLILLLALVISSLVMRFSRVAAVLIIVVVAVIGLFAWQQEREIQASRHRIPADQIELVDFKLGNPSRDTLQLTGRIRNHSTRYAVRELGLKIIIDDCLNGHCDTVDQARIIISEPIPPGQARDVSRRVVFESLFKPKGKFVPHYQITYIEAK